VRVALDVRPAGRGHLLPNSARPAALQDPEERRGVHGFRGDGGHVSELL
jgi:hypothetical protein